MSRIIRASQFAAISAAIVWSASASAETDPRGVWFDHNGRGAVEIKDCKKGKGLCGFVVHVKEKKHEDRCGTQILGNVTSSGGGWIYSPSRGKKYSVRLKRLNDSKLRVVGNASSRFFSKTFTWKRAPEDVQLCGQYAAAKQKTTVSEAELAVAAEPAPERIVERPVKREAKRKVKRVTPRKIERDVVRRAERDVVQPPADYAKRPTVEEQEEAELERNATIEQDEAIRDEVEAAKSDADEANGETEYGAVEEEEEGGEPIENDVTQVFDELIEKANKYTGDLKRKCKFRIPYVDRVIMIPCRD